MNREYFSASESFPKLNHGLPVELELELELIQTQMAQKPVLRAEVNARALRASQILERSEVLNRCFGRSHLLKAPLVHLHAV
jgi:hypothetical protein